MIIGEAEADLINDSIQTAVNLVKTGLRKAGVDPSLVTSEDETLLNEAVDYYATAEVLQVAYNPTDDDGQRHIAYYTDKADSIIATVIERMIIEEEIREHSPYTGVKERFYFNSRYKS